MALIDHPEGGYRFLPGIAPYSGGVVSAPGFEVVHATLRRPLPYRRGFDRVERHLAAEGRTRSALCGVELRSPEPFTFDGFAAFNAGYARILEAWGLFVEGVNPVARTNVAPEADPPVEPMLYGFSYMRPVSHASPPTFVVAGAGELPEGVLSPEAIVRGGETSAGAIAEKAAFVLGLMESRLHGLGAGWAQVTAIDVYTIHPIDRLLPESILRRVGTAGVHGVRWYYSRPPIEGIEFEMDVRGVRVETWLD
jgi:hypothetical protein